MMMNKNDARIEMSLWSGVIKNKYIKIWGNMHIVLQVMDNDASCWVSIQPH